MYQTQCVAVPLAVLCPDWSVVTGKADKGVELPDSAFSLCVVVDVGRTVNNKNT